MEHETVVTFTVTPTQTLTDVQAQLQLTQVSSPSHSQTNNLTHSTNQMHPQRYMSILCFQNLYVATSNVPKFLLGNPKHKR